MKQKQTHNFRLIRFTIIGVLSAAQLHTIAHAKTSHRQTSATKSHAPKSSHPARPIIEQLTPDNYCYEMGPDFHYDLAHHGAADNPPQITLEVKGQHFQQTSIVFFEGSALKTTFVSPTRLKATLPMTTITNFGDKNNTSDAKAAISIHNPTPKKGGTPQISSSSPFGISHWAMGG